MLLSEKIALIFSFWLVFVLILTGDVELEVFFILIIIGFIVLKEFTDHLTTKIIKLKISSFILVFLIAFFVLVFKRVIEHLAV